MYNVYADTWSCALHNLQGHLQVALKQYLRTCTQELADLESSDPNHMTVGKLMKLVKFSFHIHKMEIIILATTKGYWNNKCK